MPSTIPYSLAFVGIILTASLAVLGQEDLCFTKQTCQECVVTKANTTGGEGGNNGTTCIFEYTSSGNKCVDKYLPNEQTIKFVPNLEGCKDTPPSNTTTTTPATPTTPPAPTTSTTSAPTTTPGSNTTTTTTTAPPATTNATTTVPTTPTPTPSTNGTTASTTTPPSTSTAAPTPAPRKGGFAWGEFIGGIVFAVAISSLAYLIWRFYKARLDRNYHTFSNPTF